MFQDDNGLDTKCSMNTGETGTSLELQQAHRNMDFQVKKSTQKLDGRNPRTC